MINKEELRQELIDWVTAHKDAVECNALAEDPDESADYLLSLLSKEEEAIRADEREKVAKFYEGEWYGVTDTYSPQGLVDIRQALKESNSKGEGDERKASSADTSLTI